MTTTARRLPARRNDRLRVHGRGALPGLAQRPQLLRPAAPPRDAHASAAATARPPRPSPDRFGWQSVETDWHRLLTGPDIDLIDVCTPGNTHAEMAIAALEAGKHVLCEKPLANTVEEAEAMAAAAEQAAASGVRSMVGFTYRRVPAIGARPAARRAGPHRRRSATCARSTCRTGSSTRGLPLFWRLRREIAGSGALGDIGAHIVDLVQYVTGESLTGLSALTATFVKERPLPASASGLSGTSGTETGDGDVDDAAVFSRTLSGGALATFEATRFATGRKNAIRIELNGSEGSSRSTSRT